MAKWTIVAYPDEENHPMRRKVKVVEAKDWYEAIDKARREFPEYHEIGAYEIK